MFALPFVGAEFFFFFYDGVPVPPPSFCDFRHLTRSDCLTEWSVTVDLSLTTPDRISWKREIRGRQKGQIFNNSVVSFDQHNPETKRQSMEWRTKQSSRPKKFLQKSRIGTMLITFFDKQA